MEPRIFRFFQYIKSIFSNFIAGKEIIAKRRAAGAPGQPTRLSAVARSDIKETSNKVAVDQPTKMVVRRLSSRLTGFSNLFFSLTQRVQLPENFSGSSSSAFAGGIFFLFIGFVIGNLFGTFLPAIRIFFSWDGFIVIFLLFFIEFISYIRYQRKNRFFLILWAFPRGYFPLLGQEPIPLDLEDERRKQPPLNNEVTAAKNGPPPVTNDNKIAFTRNFPFFIIFEPRTFKGKWAAQRSSPVRGSKAAHFGKVDEAASFFSNDGKTTFLEGSPPFAAKGSKSFNYFKIGFLLGFFIDAYKVGS